MSKANDKLKAEKAARDIVSYWLAKGYSVKAKAVCESITIEGVTVNIWTVETDMINGLPRGWVG